jgi:hypothetical protein
MAIIAHSCCGSLRAEASGEPALVRRVSLHLLPADARSSAEIASLEVDEEP